MEENRMKLFIQRLKRIIKAVKKEIASEEYVKIEVTRTFKKLLDKKDKTDEEKIKAFNLAARTIMDAKRTGKKVNKYTCNDFGSVLESVITKNLKDSIGIREEEKKDSWVYTFSYKGVIAGIEIYADGQPSSDMILFAKGKASAISDIFLKEKIKNNEKEFLERRKKEKALAV
jgi:hypothetical protein